MYRFIFAASLAWEEGGTYFESRLHSSTEILIDLESESPDFENETYQSLVLYRQLLITSQSACGLS